MFLGIPRVTSTVKITAKGNDTSPHPPFLRLFLHQQQSLKEVANTENVKSGNSVHQVKKRRG